MPFADGGFDVVFSKDAMVHIADKEALLAEIFRVLRPGGIIAAGDWMSSTDGAFSAAMIAYLELEGLGFGIGRASRSRERRAPAFWNPRRMIPRYTLSFGTAGGQSRFPLLVTEQLIYALEAIALSAQAAEPPLGLVRV